MNMSSFIVSGAANGIGYSICKNIILQGYHVIALDRDATALKKLSDQYTDNVTTINLDLSDYENIENTLQSEINNRTMQGVIISHGIALDHDIEDNPAWNKVIATNLISVQRILSASCKHIVDYGRVVIISSILGKVGKKQNVAYCTSKHALLGLTKSLALDLSDRKITVNSILPSWVDTDMLRRELKPQAELIGCSVETLLNRIKKRIPLRELVKPDDIADAVSFFISKHASMITAQSLVIDGGDGCGV